MWRSLKMQQAGARKALWVGVLFFAVMLIVGVNRYFTLFTSYDHGLFTQLFWNNLNGDWFQSSLTSSNSVESLEDGVIPRTSFFHLGQHLVLSFTVLTPFVAWAIHPLTLMGLQTLLMTLGGWVLYALARCRLPVQLSLWIMASYYASNAVIGPTVANFYEHCQVPLYAFGLFLALEKRRWIWFWLCAALLLGVREEVGGIILFGLGVYLLLSKRMPRWFGLGLCVVGFGYVAIATNVIMPQFSSDNSRLYLATRFRQFVDTPNPSTLQVLWGMITHPIELLKSFLWPIGPRFFYLVRQWLPLAFIPAVSPATWALTAFPLLSLFLQKGVSALSISLRYSLIVVPGLFYGAILWWGSHGEKFTPKFRRRWAIAMALSIILSITSNPNRAFSWLIPDSIEPRVYISLPTGWAHGLAARSVMAKIPPKASVATTTYLIPPLSTRRSIVRLPVTEIRGDNGVVNQVDYIIADFWQIQKFKVAFKEERTALARILPVIDGANAYGVVAYQDGVVLLAKGVGSDPKALNAWQSFRFKLLQK
jgi:uncharacterized membrane protein